MGVDSLQPRVRAERRAGAAAGARRSARSCRGKGCGECRGTGFKGRKAIGELLVLNDELRELIIARAPARKLKEAARAAGTVPLRDAALQLVKPAKPLSRRSTVSLLWRNRIFASACAPSAWLLRATRSRASTLPVQVNPEPARLARRGGRAAGGARRAQEPRRQRGARRPVRALCADARGTRRSSPRTQWLTLARHRLSAVHGAAAADWEIKLTETAPMGPRLACAVDRALIDEMAAKFVSANARLSLGPAFPGRGVQPHPRHHRQRLVLAGDRGAGPPDARASSSAASGSRSAAAASTQRWRAMLPEIIERESAFLALSERRARA